LKDEGLVLDVGELPEAIEEKEHGLHRKVLTKIIATKNQIDDQNAFI